MNNLFLCTTCGTALTFRREIGAGPLMQMYCKGCAKMFFACFRTHPGTFHADDVFSTALLSILFNNGQQLSVYRGVRPYERCNLELVYDIGMEHDPENLAFDHHQFKEGEMTRKCGTPYAAFGLLWKHFGTHFGDEVHEKVDERLVKFVDAVDNGSKVGGYSISSAIWSFNNTDRGWEKAVDIAIDVLSNEIRLVQEEIDGRGIVLSAERRGRTIVLPKFVQWQEPITLRPDYDKLLYVVFPSLRGGWNVQQVPPRPFASEGRKPLPESLFDSGLLQEVAGEGESDSLFVHRGRFIGGASTFEGVMRIAEYAEQS